MRDRITWTITVTLCSFLLLSLVGTFALEWVGKETGTIWGRIFDLINVLAGAVVGFIAGQQVKIRHNEDDTLPEPDEEPQPDQPRTSPVFSFDDDDTPEDE